MLYSGLYFNCQHFLCISTPTPHPRGQSSRPQGQILNPPLDYDNDDNDDDVS